MEVGFGYVCIPISPMKKITKALTHGSDDEVGAQSSVKNCTYHKAYQDFCTSSETPIKFS